MFTQLRRKLIYLLMDCETFNLNASYVMNAIRTGQRRIQDPLKHLRRNICKNSSQRQFKTIN